MPPMDEILPTFGDGPWPYGIQHVIDQYTDETGACNYPATVEGLDWMFTEEIHDVLSKGFPSVNWLLPMPQREQIKKWHETAARWSLGQLAQVQDQTPPDPTAPLVIGTLHEALQAYEEKREKDFTLPDGTFDGSGHHMLRMIRRMRERQEDFPLAQLDFSRCQSLLDFWRNRPENLEKGGPLSRKTCQNYIGEMGRFFDWLHLTNEFRWRKPPDHNDLKTLVRKLPSDRRSITAMEIRTFSIEELVLLNKHASPYERLLLVWSLNCAHGAAEFGRVEWEDVLLHQEHPWLVQGLKIETTPEDSWCGFIRPKSDVLGWWYLWPETVKLLEWWRSDLKQQLQRDFRPTDRVLLTSEDAPLYRDESGNAQTGFAASWKRLLDRVQKREGAKSIRRLPFGTLRDQLSDWLGGEHAKALVASVALCHGIPHQGDKLLYKHYSNRPWGELFKSQREYREYLSPMFDAVSDLLVEYDPLQAKVEALWNTGERKILKIAEFLGVSEMTVRRRLAVLRKGDQTNVQVE